MSTDMVPFQSLLAHHVQRLSDALQGYLHSSGTTDMYLTSGSWSNANGIATAYLTCTPQNQRSEEHMIDVVISVQDLRGTITLTIDICRSCGEILIGIGEWRIASEYLDGLLRKLDTIYNQAEEDILTHLKSSVAKRP